MTLTVRTPNRQPIYEALQLLCTRLPVALLFLVRLTIPRQHQSSVYRRVVTKRSNVMHQGILARATAVLAILFFREAVPLPPPPTSGSRPMPSNESGSEEGATDGTATR